jgi:RNA polymerase subunit RPABC4/transcription elongation factor Spt4
MPACKNCGAFVTEAYVQVFAPSGLETVRICPYCEDKVREGAEVRASHAPRRP